MFLSQKLWHPSRLSCKAYKLYRSVLTGQIDVRTAKIFVPSWPKVVSLVADGKDLATCGLSIGILLGSSLHD